MKSRWVTNRFECSLCNCSIQQFIRSNQNGERTEVAVAKRTAENFYGLVRFKLSFVCDIDQQKLQQNILFNDFLKLTVFIYLKNKKKYF